jgi:ferrous iron transport protein A
VQLTFNKEIVADAAGPRPSAQSLVDLQCGESAVLESLDVSEDLGRRLMELGFFPGGDVVAACSAPGGDPRVYRVDGSEIALRAETARFLMVKPGSIRSASSQSRP